MKKILIIDDEPQLRTVLRDILTNEGFAVEDASDGTLGLALWRKDPADLVLTDLFMPNKDGIETIMELKRTQPQAKIIAMTGGGSWQLMQIVAAAGFLGADRMIEKPFDRQGLLTAVRSLLSEPRHLNETAGTNPSAELTATQGHSTFLPRPCRDREAHPADLSSAG